MGLFGGNKKNERELSFAMGTYKFTADNEYVSYRSPYGKSFRVLRKDIESVSLDKGGAGKNIIKVNGHGTLLAEVEMPRPWAEKIQEFIMKEALGKGKQNSASEINDLEKLAELKKKGIITEEEFKQKKKQLLGI